MTSTSERAVVFIRLPGIDYVPAGLLRHEDRAYFFRYGRRYLQRPDAIPLDPARMPLADMEFSGSTLFSALRDAAPDRWGRKVLGLMAGRAPGTLSEFEVLTAAHHPQRMGALAFGPTPDGPASLAPWATGDAFCMVPEDLGRVAAIVARVDEFEDDEDLDELRDGLPEDAFLAALASSLSLGGARPKAMVTLDGASWIAKFSKRGDPWREPVVEHATMTLAARCGITVASTRLLELDGRFVLLVKRFDRLDGDSRHVISSFTVTGAEEDGDWGSYQNMAEQARRLGDAQSGPEIFRRMAFNALCSNRDDHLRNHAFFVSRKAIAMTPALRSGALLHPLQAMGSVPALRAGRPRGHAVQYPQRRPPLRTRRTRGRGDLGRDAENGRRLAGTLRGVRRDGTGDGRTRAPLHFGGRLDKDRIGRSPLPSSSAHERRHARDVPFPGVGAESSSPKHITNRQQTFNLYRTSSIKKADIYHKLLQ